MALPLESVPNVSEGRDERVLAALRDAFATPARLLDVHADPDHHRSVFTLVGEPDALVETLVRGVRRALELVDLREHAGVHPRVGAADVVPLVGIRPEDEGRARKAALALADRIASELELPVFFYGRLSEDGREPAFFRRGGTAELARRLAAGELRPDRGPDRLHTRGGAVILGVRRPLIAFNVNLRSRDLDLARELARLVRERDGGFPGVRALGLALPTPGLVQVSMNVTDWEAAPPHEIVARHAPAARARGVRRGGGAPGGRDAPPPPRGAAPGAGGGTPPPRPPPPPATPRRRAAGGWRATISCGGAASQSVT
ncbi:MAG: hypothetical protein ICV74_07250, partial [Thermoleophilia bacterium]|nr:hypothetical protein [Thermoleophilia bacterium]